MVYQHVTPAVANVMIDASSSPTQDTKATPKHGGVHYCSSCPPGPHTHHVYSPANCHPQQAPFMDHAHCGCQPGYVDGHFHFPHQQTPPRPVTVMAHPPPLLLRPVQPQHMQQHQVNMVSQYLFYYIQVNLQIYLLLFVHLNCSLLIFKNCGFWFEQTKIPVLDQNYHLELFQLHVTNQVYIKKEPISTILFFRVNISHREKKQSFRWFGILDGINSLHNPLTPKSD